LHLFGDVPSYVIDIRNFIGAGVFGDVTRLGFTKVFGNRKIEFRNIFAVCDDANDGNASQH